MKENKNGASDLLLVLSFSFVCWFIAYLIIYYGK